MPSNNMSAHYDNFDYPAYWTSRSYEHECEVLALKKLMSKIPKIDRILDIGAGFGRLTPYYIHRSKKVVLSDPSKRLLTIAEKKLKIGKQNNRSKITTLQSSLENLPKKLKPKSFDLILMIRVMHHLSNPDDSLSIISGLLKENGYLIIEFPNKLHWKALCQNFIKGNLTFPFEIYPTDIRSTKNKRAKSIPFLNFHPDTIMDSLNKHKLTVIESLSVSNVRSPFLKRNIPLEFLLALEDKTQKPFSRLRFGPSMFVLAKKRG